MIQRLFLAHPQSVGETYGEHMRVASRFGVLLIAGGIGCLIHALLPSFHTRTGSKTVFRLNAELRGRQPTPAEMDGALIYEI